MKVVVVKAEPTAPHILYFIGNLASIGVTLGTIEVARCAQAVDGSIHELSHPAIDTDDSELRRIVHQGQE
jgi:hypothetical protein